MGRQRKQGKEEDELSFYLVYREEEKAGRWRRGNCDGSETEEEEEEEEKKVAKSTTTMQIGERKRAKRNEDFLQHFAFPFHTAMRKIVKNALVFATTTQSRKIQFLYIFPFPFFWLQPWLASTSNVRCRIATINLFNK